MDNKYYFNEADIKTSSSSNGSDSTKSVDIQAAKDSATARGKLGDAAANSNKNSNVEGSIQSASLKNAYNVLAQSGSDGFDQNKYTETATKYIKSYSAARNNLFGGILNGLNNMHTDYMQIIRAHVNTYLGKTDNADDNTGKSSISTQNTNSGTSSIKNTDNNQQQTVT